MSVHATRDLRHRNELKKIKPPQKGCGFPSCIHSVIIINSNYITVFKRSLGRPSSVSALPKGTENTVGLFIGAAFDALTLLLEATGLSAEEYGWTSHQAAFHSFKASSWGAFCNNLLLKTARKPENCHPTSPEEGSKEWDPRRRGQRENKCPGLRQNWNSFLWQCMGCSWDTILHLFASPSKWGRLKFKLRCFLKHLHKLFYFYNLKITKA